MTALLFAVDGDHVDCVRQLLYAGASPDGPFLWPGHESESELTRTPLVTAMLNNSLASVRLLIQARHQASLFYLLAYLLLVLILSFGMF